MAHFAFRSAKQCLAVHAHAHEVEDLLLSDDVVSRSAFERWLQIGAKAWIGGRRKHRFAQVLKTVFSGVRYEFRKVQRMMNRAQLIVIDGLWAAFLHLF